ncbi:MAG: biotin--[acetyl-CoA-carboxylase] ligase [Candidatus Lightella neohaematopini]|nr:biotin--[acetyl-CoA-carboxylase] ligase [Candidatus Lightella neohaematopini]MCV2529063.1 biotin--[acetyl-CoA-carboxylase] ligase [Candidatus Lightella neohaematopini]
MNNVNTLIKLISILSDGNVHCYYEIKNYLIFSKNINYYINLANKLGLFIIKKPSNCYQLLNPFTLLNKNIILSYLKLETIKLIVIPIINSTNKYLVNKLSNIYDKCYVCVSEYQTNSIGRNGKKWINSFGNSLCLSICWLLNKPLLFNTISIVISIILVNLLKKLGIKNIGIKWPNDLYLKNKKLAGILVESIISNNNLYIIIGIGINLNMSNNSLLYKLGGNWINLIDAGIIINRNILTAKIINSIYYGLLFFERNGFNYFFSLWKKLDIFFNYPVLLCNNFYSNSFIYGINRGINQYGAILIETNNVVHAYYSGSLYLKI